ncbi:MAG TPA: FIST N-terminal domain-containing protein [Polyangiaceae bacterium]|jgi:methyl-accepting chemotaxis protein|nr:FIST N-terminal domain-containing protein [Polyangiaceae bacterium]
MATIVGSGASTKREALAAGAEAARSALERLGSAKPAFGFLFASPDHDLRLAMKGAREAAGCTDILGSSTAGELTEQGLQHGGVVVMLVASDSTSHHLVMGEGLRGNCKKVADDLCKSILEAKRVARTKDQRQLTTVVLTDGLAGTGEELVNNLFERALSGCQIVGGAAGDEGRFKETTVGAGREAANNAAAALHVFGRRRWGIGVNHGLRSTTKPMLVTRSSANVIYEIDGEPAFEVYRRHALERQVRLTPESAGPYMIAHELGVHFFDKISRARAPLSVGKDRSLHCAAGVPEGCLVSILDGEPLSMVQAAKSAAEEARDTLEGAKAAGVLLFDCVCRGMILKDRFDEEIAAVRGVFGDVPIAGFLTYGEIARYAGRFDGWHNATAVVAAIPA